MAVDEGEQTMTHVINSPVVTPHPSSEEEDVQQLKATPRKVSVQDANGDNASVVRRLSRKLSEEIRMRDLEYALGASSMSTTTTTTTTTCLEPAHEDGVKGECEEEEEDEEEDEPMTMLSIKDADSIVAALRTRCIAKRNELDALGAPPTTTQLLELFREFAMCYSAEVYDNGHKLREVFDASAPCTVPHASTNALGTGSAAAETENTERSALTDALTALSSQLDEIVSVDNLVRECSRVDGLAPYLLAPERCLRRVTRDGIALARAPVAQAVESVFGVLMNARDGALRRLEEKLMMRGVGIGAAGVAATSREVMSEVLISLLREWKDDSSHAVLDAVRMEEMHIDDAFFNKRLTQRRHELAERLRAAADATAAAEAASLARHQKDSSSNNDDAHEHGEDERPKTPTGGALSITSIPHLAVASALSPRSSARADPKDYRMGYMDKMGSKRTWARRFFVLSERHGRLYVFRSAKEKVARAMIDLRLCEFIIDEGSDHGTPEQHRGIFIRAIAATPSSDLSSDLVVDPRTLRNKYIYKGRSSLRLRADSRAAQHQWLACLEASKARATAMSGRRSARKQQQEEEKEEEAAVVVETENSNDDNGQETMMIQRGDTAFSLDPRLLADPKRWISARCLAPDDELLRMAADDVRTYCLMAHAEIARSTPKLIVLQMINRAGGDEILSSLIARAAALPPSAAAQALGEPMEKTLARTMLKRELASIEEAEQEAAMTIKVSRRMMKKTNTSRASKNDTASVEIPIPTRIMDLTISEPDAGMKTE